MNTDFSYLNPSNHELKQIPESNWYVIIGYFYGRDYLFDIKPTQNIYLYTYKTETEALYSFKNTQQCVKIIYKGTHEVANFGDYIHVNIVRNFFNEYYNKHINVIDLEAKPTEKGVSDRL